jgi:general secretion pathway protein M
MTAVSGGIVPTVEQTSTAQGVRSAITKIEPDGSNGARVTIEGATFNTMVMWLSELQSSNGIVTEEATIDAQTTPGMVNARLRLRSSAGGS